MGSESSRPTPLGVARARFVDGLPRKAGELRGSIALLAATPGEERPREELRRRLHALYASAQVFQILPLTNALKDAIARLDRARDEKRALEGGDLDALASLAATLPLLGQADPTPDMRAAEEPDLSEPEIPAPPRAPRAPATRRNTLEMAGAPPPSEPPPSSVAPGPRESERSRAMSRDRSMTLRGLPAMHGSEPPVVLTPPRADEVESSAPSESGASAPSSWSGLSPSPWPTATERRSSAPPPAPDLDIETRATSSGAVRSEPAEASAKRESSPGRTSSSGRVSSPGAAPAASSSGTTRASSASGAVGAPRASTPPFRPASTRAVPPRTSARPPRDESARGPQTVVSVLVADAAEWQARVRAVLPAERFEVLGAADPEEALRLARSSAPDAVLVDHAALESAGVELVRRLRDDPLTDFVPVIALVPASAQVDLIALRELGADEVLAKPFERNDLELLLARLTGSDIGRGALAGLAGEHTIEEVASRIADEVKRGLVESADRGRDVRVPLGDGAEVLAAAWSAIGRVRAHLAQRSGGRLHFRDDRAPGGPAFLALVDEDDTPDPKSAPVSLRDRRVIVADDDPAVVWFFASLLREEGMQVHEASDGAEALELALRQRPDLVISDILMPRLDGFGLTRELKRNPALADVPVILLSWKEDFLQRMRELQSGASGYLRKESGAAQILDCVRDVLRPRARLEAQLRAGGDVRGRLERIGLLPLVQTVAQHRPDSRVTVRDAWNLFELDIRKGDLVDVTRTASDGSFSRGPRVMVPLLGATVGRFAVALAEAPVRPSIKEPLDVVLRKGAQAISAVVDAVSGKGLALAAHVELDDDVIASLLRASPDAMRDMIERLREVGGPRALLMEGSVAPHELESLMLDLARQGAIVAVRGPDGEDRIAAAASARGEIDLPTRTPSLSPGRSPSLEPPALEPIGAEGALPDDEGSGLSWLPTEETTKEIVLEAHRLASQAPPPPTDAGRASDAGKPGEARPEILELDGPDQDPGPRRRRESGTMSAVSAPEPSERGPEASPAAPPPAATLAAEPPVLEAPVSKASHEPELEFDSAPSFASIPVPPATPAPPESAPELAALVASSKPEAPQVPLPGILAEPAPPPPPPAAVAKPVAKPAPAAPAPEAGGMGLLGWAFLLAVLVVAGFVAKRSIESRTETPVTEPAPPPPTTPEPPGETPPEGAPGAAPAVAAPSTEPAPAPGAAPAAAQLRSYGEDLPTIDPALGVEVGEGQGVVLVQPAPDGTPIRVRLQGRELQITGEPQAIALPAGVYDIAFIRGDHSAFRYVHVAPGHTRRVTAP